MEESSKNAVEGELNTNLGEENPKRVHLFNCDNTFNLDSVEKLFCEVKDYIKKKLCFDIQLPIRKNYFALSKMSEMCETTISRLQMDLAVFVVHAHESGLKINGDSPGFGYARFYRALLEVTGENVLIVIGGDDQYSNTNEEERFVISRWATRKIFSQFQQQYMDGRKSFIFSWNKKHRAIHEEALLHYFDLNKKGQKFEYQPKHHSEVSSRGKESEAENKNQKQEVKDNPDIRDEDPCNDDQRPNDVGDDKGMLEEDTESLSLDDYDLCSDFEREEFEGGSISDYLLQFVFFQLASKGKDVTERQKMLQPRKIHLLNCDRTYKLDAVEDLLSATKAKSRFVHMEKHYFSLAEMDDMSTKIIPKLDVNLAFFVVHAHESRLSINEDNAGIGYAKIYRALLKAAGENVIIVIGGDDNYINEDEEERFVISRWAKRKIASQFSEEFLDGRKGFIFSWNKKHRPIHEEALMHLLESSKKGVKFVHQPPQRKLSTNPVTPPPMRSTKLVQPFNLHSSLPVDSLRSWQGSFASSSTESQARKYNVPSVSILGEGPKDISQPEIWKARPKELAILDCGVSDNDLKAVTQVFNDLRPMLGVSTDTAVESCSLTSAKSYLLRNSLRFCVLMVDAKTVKDVYERFPQGRVEYEDLLRTATHKVVEKVILVICSSGAMLSLKDEAISTEKVGGIFQDTNKGIMVWMRHGSLAVEPDVLAQMIMAPGSPLETPKPRMSYQDDFARPRYTTQSFDPDRTDRQEQTGRRNSELPMYDYGSNYARWKDPTLQQSQGLVPSHPFENYMHTSEAVEEIVQDPKSNKVRWSVDPKSRRSAEHQEVISNSANKTLMLETRVRYGDVSMKKNDLKFTYPDWYIPRYLIESLKHKYHSTPDAKLYVISDLDGNLRSIVETDIKDEAMNFLKKTKKKITDLMAREPSE